MRNHRAYHYILFPFFLLLVSVSSISAQETGQDSTSNPLAYFEHLIGGAWTADKTQQTFEWGVGEKSVVSKLYYKEPDSLRLIGEITWFWHPGLQKIKGYGTSIEMAMDFFDYTTTFEGRYKMVNTFMGYGGHIDGVAQLETLEFISEDKYKWTYFNKEGNEFHPSYSITFNREEL